MIDTPLDDLVASPDLRRRTRSLISESWIGASRQALDCREAWVGPDNEGAAWVFFCGVSGSPLPDALRLGGSAYCNEVVRQVVDLLSGAGWLGVTEGHDGLPLWDAEGHPLFDDRDTRFFFVVKAIGLWDGGYGFATPSWFTSLSFGRAYRLLGYQLRALGIELVSLPGLNRYHDDTTAVVMTFRWDDVLAPKGEKVSELTRALEKLGWSQVSVVGEHEGSVVMSALLPLVSRPTEKAPSKLQIAKTLIEGRIAMSEKTAAVHPDVLSAEIAKARVDAYRLALLDLEAAEATCRKGEV